MTRIPKHATIVLAALALALAGCTVTYVPADEAPGVRARSSEAPERSDRVINAHLDLRAPAGARVLRVESDGRDSEGVIATELGLRALFADIDDQLQRDGWNRTEAEIASDEVEAEYRRRGDELELEIEREGRDRYTFEVELD